MNTTTSTASTSIREAMKLSNDELEYMIVWRFFELTGDDEMSANEFVDLLLGHCRFMTGLKVTLASAEYDMDHRSKRALLLFSAAEETAAYPEVLPQQRPTTLPHLVETVVELLGISEGDLDDPTNTAHIELDDFGNYRTDSGRLIVAEQKRIDGRRLRYSLTTRQAQAVAQAYADGQRTVTNIGLDHGIGHTTVRRIATNHGVPVRKPALSASKQQLNKREALSLRKAGLSIPKIAKALDASHRAVADLFARTPEARMPFAEAIKHRTTSMKGKSPSLD